MLGIHDRRLLGGVAEEASIEGIAIGQDRAPTNKVVLPVDLGRYAQLVQLGIGERPEAVPAMTQVVPERGQVGRLGKSPGHADHSYEVVKVWTVVACCIHSVPLCSFAGPHVSTRRRRPARLARRATACCAPASTTSSVAEPTPSTSWAC